MGSVFGGGSAKKAARMQADAIRYQTKMNVSNANLGAQAAAQQMANAQAQRVAQKYAEDLLSTPAEAAQVNLRPEDLEADGDLLTRRRGVRSTYRQQPRASGISLL